MSSFAFQRWNVLWLAAAVACGSEQADEGCTVESRADGAAIIRCADGSEKVVEPVGSSPGTDGTSCTVSESEAGVVTIRCPDGTEATVNDGQNGAPGANGMDGQNGAPGANGMDGQNGAPGANGQDGAPGQNGAPGANGTSCTVAEQPDGTKLISCSDGSSVTVRDGQDGEDGAPGANGTSCTVSAQADGTKLIACSDGTSVTVRDGQNGQDGAPGQNGAPGANGTSCTVSAQADGTKLIACSDGTSVTVRDGQNGQDGQDGTPGQNGQDGQPCSVAYVGRGVSEVRCPDGTAVTLASGYRAQIVAGDDHTCLLGRDGAVDCWGLDLGSRVTPPAGVRFERIAASRNTTCGIDVEGAVRCWGDGLGGPLPASGAWREIALGVSGGCVLDAAGAVGCFGDLGGYERAVPAGSSSLTVYERAACVITPDARPLCWTDSGVLNWSFAPGRAVQVERGCVRFDDGTLDCSYAYGNRPASATLLRSDGSLGTCGLSAGALTCPGRNGLGLPSGADIVDFAVGTHHACLLERDDQVVCAGTYPVLDGLRASLPDEDGFVAVEVAPDGAACAQRADGTLRCFGELAATTTPAGVFVDFGVGYGKACGLRADGSLECWGRTSPLDAIPVLGEGVTFRSIDVSGQLACAMTTTRWAYCWGAYSGRSNVSFSPSPWEQDRTFVDVQVGENGLVCWLDDAGSGVCQRESAQQSVPSRTEQYDTLWTGFESACARATDGTVACGYPHATGLPSGLTDLAPGETAACGLDADGALYCWGSGAPTYVGGLRETTYRAIDLARNLACALTAEGRVVCWGAEDAGQADVPAAHR